MVFVIIFILTRKLPLVLVLKFPLCLTWHVLPRTVLSRVDMLLIILFPPLGEYDHLPEVAFYMVGDISEAVAKAERLAEEVQ